MSLKLGSEFVSFEIKSSDGLSQGKFICKWLLKAMLIINYMFLFNLSAEGHEGEIHFPFVMASHIEKKPIQSSVVLAGISIGTLLCS